MSCGMDGGWVKGVAGYSEGVVTVAVVVVAFVVFGVATIIVVAGGRAVCFRLTGGLATPSALLSFDRPKVSVGRAVLGADSGEANGPTGATEEVTEGVTEGAMEGVTEGVMEGAIEVERESGEGAVKDEETVAEKPGEEAGGRVATCKGCSCSRRSNRESMD